MLLRVSEMVCRNCRRREMDINPIIVDERGAVAVDARIVIDHAPRPVALRPNHYGHLAILPYPARFEQIWPLPGGGNTPSAPSAPMMRRCCKTWYWGSAPRAAISGLCPSISELPPSMLARFTLIDYDREMALVACTASARPGPTDSSPRANASWVSRYVTNPGSSSCEFALLGRRFQRQGWVRGSC